MGTRADFYVGEGETAEWLGSIAWDGYPEGIAGVGGKIGDPKMCPLFTADTEVKYRRCVHEFLAAQDDATRPEQGWPWPWETSAGTDYAYTFHDGAVRMSWFGRAWVSPVEDEPEGYDESTGRVAFKDMSATANVPLTGPRSGLIVLGVTVDKT